MRQVNIHQAKTHLSRLIQAALDGEEIIIAKGKQPLVKLTPLAEARPARRLGGLEGKVWISDDFDAPLEDFNRVW